MWENDDGGNELEPQKASKWNEAEADICVSHLQSLVEAGVGAGDIALISPYMAQVQHLKSRLRNVYPELEIGTVDGFQGREKEAILVSLVRSNETKAVGFLSETRRLNVALTRAKRHLFIVADSSTISSDASMKTLVAYLEEHAEIQYPIP